MKVILFCRGSVKVLSRNCVIIKHYERRLISGNFLGRTFRFDGKCGQNNKVICRIFNPWNRPCNIPKGFSVATLSSTILNEPDTDSRKSQRPTTCHSLPTIQQTRCKNAQLSLINLRSAANSCGCCSHDCCCCRANGRTVGRYEKNLYCGQQQNIPTRTDGRCVRCSEKENIYSKKPTQQQATGLDGRYAYSVEAYYGAWH